MSCKAPLVIMIYKNRYSKQIPHSTISPQLTHDIHDIIRKQFPIRVAMKFELDSLPLYIPRAGISFKIVYFQCSLLLDFSQKGGSYFPIYKKQSVFRI